MASGNIKVAFHDVLAAVSDGRLYLVNRPGGGEVSGSVYRFERKATLEDGNMTPLPERAYQTPPSGGSGAGSGGTPPSQPNTDRDPPPVDKHTIFTEKLEKVDDVKQYFDKLTPNTMLDLKQFGPISSRAAVLPGTMDAATASDVSKALGKLQSELMKDDSNAAVAAFLLAFLQNLLSYSTSTDAEAKDEYGVYIEYGDKPFLAYGVIRATIDGAVAGKSYENPVRQYARLFTATVTSLINNGKLQPNSKVAAQHGVVRKFIAYTFDFARPNHSFYNPNQIRAWQLAQTQAFARKTGSNSTTLHNTVELGKQV